MKSSMLENNVWRVMRPEDSTANPIDVWGNSTPPCEARYSGRFYDRSRFGRVIEGVLTFDVCFAMTYDAVK